MGSGIGYQSPYKRYDRPEIACWGFGCSNSEERMCKYECWQETSGTAWKQNPRRNFQGTWDHQIFLCHEVVDGVLHFMVNFNLPLIRPYDETYMETLETDVGTVGGG